MLLLFVTSMNRFANGTANWTTNVLAPMVMAQYISTAHTVRYQALLILALGNVLPQSFHAGAVWRYGTSAIFVLTLGGVAKK